MWQHLALHANRQHSSDVAAICCRIIKSMYQRLSYLRNPRYAAQAAAPASLPLKGSSTAHRRRTGCKPDRSSTVQPRQYGSPPVLTAAEAGFGVQPALGVLFDAYQPGEACFQTVQLQNMGTIMRQLRLLPPSSRYFQLSFPRQAGSHLGELQQHHR